LASRGYRTANRRSSLIVVAELALASAVYEDILKGLEAGRRHQLPHMVLCGLIAASQAALAGAVVGAWLATGPVERQSLWGGIYGVVLGLAVGALVSAVKDLDWLFRGMLLGGGSAGVLGAVLARAFVSWKGAGTPRKPIEVLSNGEAETRTSG
jgi:MFS family permease